MPRVAVQKTKTRICAISGQQGRVCIDRYLRQRGEVAIASGISRVKTQGMMMRRTTKEQYFVE